MYSGVSTGGGGFNQYGVGAKRYGSGLDAPNIGAVDKTGYAERDAVAQARKKLVQKRMQKDTKIRYQIM